MNTKTKKRNKIKKRIRKVVFGTSERPRMTVFRSNKAIYAQIINDKEEKTLVSASSIDKDLKLSSNNKTEVAKQVGVCSCAFEGFRTFLKAFACFRMFLGKCNS